MGHPVRPIMSLPVRPAARRNYLTSFSVIRRSTSRLVWMNRGFARIMSLFCRAIAPNYMRQLAGSLLYHFIKRYAMSLKTVANVSENKELRNFQWQRERLLPGLPDRTVR